MENLTLQQLFGVNASQDNQTLTIRKSDLPLLTPSNSNTAESLLTAILIKALSNFQGFIEDENGNAITNEIDNPIEFNNQNYYSLNLFRWRDNLINRANLLFVRHTIVIEVFSPNED
ncbi:hypothetical protein [Nostoc sp. FACHB-110]|uniref:hypothetical protein n=1 Tax=Nostoc sp. FACHB-110 TaxID=2692834 RepID=UPI001684A544|nr:hypothetical protein [Nostoc sp. FACHB-110]MBD2438260.1 hypothetical protein [Nostoc sp. FACHB-110]